MRAWKLQKSWLLAAALLLAAAGWLAGCSGGPRYFRLPLDLDKVRRVAVLPIQNLTRENGAGDKVRRKVVAELLAQGRLEVVEPGSVDRTMRQLQVPSLQASSDDLHRLGEALGVQAVFCGSVSEYSLTRAGGNLEAPEVAIELFLIDTSTGAILWSAVEAESGLSFWVRHFGAEPVRLSEQTGRVVHSMLSTLSARPTRQPFPEDARLKEERLKREAQAAARGGREKRLKAIEEMLGVGLRQQVLQRVAQVKRTDEAVHILCALDVFFDFGKVNLSEEGQQVAERLAQVLKERGTGQTVEVAVYPEEGEVSEEVQSRYGSIWELSAARAVALLQAFEKDGVEPSLLKASYYGAKRSGQAAAERVEITILFPLVEEKRPPEAVDLSGGV